MSASQSPRSLRILMLHGYTQSGPLFHAKTKALEKSLKRAFPPPSYNTTLHFPSGPLVIKPADVPNSTPSDPDAEASAVSAEDSYGWWRRKDKGVTPMSDGEKDKSTPKGGDQNFVYEGIDEGLDRVAAYLKEEGPFDGVIGFSQGACLAGMVASLLEPGRKAAFDRQMAEGGREYPQAFLKDKAGSKADVDSGDEDVIHPPLSFAVEYSGFAPDLNPLYTPFYNPKIATPVLHFLGSLDTVVEETRTLRLVDACAVPRDSEEGQRRIVYHPGGHFLPASQRQCVSALVGFIREVMEGERDGSRTKASEDEDVPF